MVGDGSGVLTHHGMAGTGGGRGGGWLEEAVVVKFTIAGQSVLLALGGTGPGAQGQHVAAPLHLTALLTPGKKLSLRLAALLHEADDHKYFPDNDKFQNAKRICRESILSSVSDRERIISDVILMISLVSASVNGNSVPEAARSDPTLLWPRWCDRLESIGVIGAVRCYQYAREKGTEPLMLDSTPRPRSEEEVWQYVTEDRWTHYQSSGGQSASMIDHYYDKLLHVANFAPEVVQSSYLVGEARRRVAPLVEVCVEAGISGQAPVQSLDKLEKSLMI